MARNRTRNDERPREQRRHKPHPNHHLWRNGRLWWVAFTVHLPGWQKERIRLSLGTADLEQARHARDELLRRYPETRDCELSLRLAPPRPRQRKGATPLQLAPPTSLDLGTDAHEHRGALPSSALRSARSSERAVA